MVFIVSTTGDGEPPDNALQFVKRIKKKTLASDHYKHLCYALLGKSYYDGASQRLSQLSSQYRDFHLHNLFV